MNMQNLPLQALSPIENLRKTPIDAKNPRKRCSFRGGCSFFEARVIVAISSFRQYKQRLYKTSQNGFASHSERQIVL